VIRNWALGAFLLNASLVPLAATDWPKWRGPSDNGVAPGEAPLKWSDTENIKWKATIPGRGFSSPVIWKDRIFLTTAVPVEGGEGQTPPSGGGPTARIFGSEGPQPSHRFEVLCLDKNTGKLIWQKTAKVAAPHEGYHRKYGSFASNSPVTDGKVLIAFFGSRGVYAYDLNGKLLWEKDLGLRMKMRNAFGEGTAPVLYGDAVILNNDAEQGSFITVLDKNTGRELWRQSRDEPSAWSAPLVVEHGGKTQVIVSASNKVRSYDLKTGKVIWECAGLGLNVIPAPVYADGVVYVMSGYRNPNLMAIRLGREGDLTGTDAIVWTNTRGNSYTPSPVLHNGILYFLTDNGQISAFDAASGKPYYHQQRLPKPYNFKASPVLVNGRLYLASEEGDVIVLKAGPQYEVLAINTLTDQFFVSTPAVSGGEIFLRGHNTLFCVSERK
jgi:outer membrane protein assembly factor BamB